MGRMSLKPDRKILPGLQMSAACLPVGFDLKVDTGLLEMCPAQAGVADEPRSTLAMNRALRCEFRGYRTGDQALVGSGQSV